MSEDRVSVREFIYLDINRVESVLAQFSQGLVNIRTRTDDQSQTQSIGGGANLIGIAKAEGNLAWRSAETNSESTILHDFAFVEMEEYLHASGNLRPIGENNDEPPRPTDFLLFEGNVVFEDYEYLAQMIADFPSILGSLADLGHDTVKVESGSGRPRRKHSRSGPQNNGELLTKKYIQALEYIIRTFYRDRLIVKCETVFQGKNYRIQGPLKRDFLRDHPDELRFKFGDRPSGNWKMLSQVASVGNQFGKKRRLLNSDSVMDIALAELFSQLENVERVILGNTPLVSVSPIAVYRSTE